MITRILLPLLLTATFSMATDLYTDTYMARSGITKGHIETGIPNPFNVNRIQNMKNVSHVSIYFRNGVMTETSQKKLETMISKAVTLQGKYYITIIGHTASFTNESRKIVLSPWAEFWQNLGTKKMTKSALAETVNIRIQAVYNYLESHHIPVDHLYNENRMDRDPIATEATKEGRILNQRVDVALYR